MAQKLKKIGDKLRGKMRMLSVLCMTTMLLSPARTGDQRHNRW